MKNTNNLKTFSVISAIVLVFGVIAFMPQSANASYGYNGGYGGGNYNGAYYGGASYSNYGGTYIQGLAGYQSPWYPSMVVPSESQTFYMEQTWRNYGFSSSDFNSRSGFNSNSYYSTSSLGSIRGSYGY